MKLHIFNPEHDLALAFGSPMFTPPHAARQLRADIGFLPALFAEDGDMVLVDDIDNATNQLRYVKGQMPVVDFVTPDILSAVISHNIELEAVCPWGWDDALCHSLRRCASQLESLLPSAKTLQELRTISNRRWAAAFLHNSGVYCTTIDEVHRRANEFGLFVLKSPWSCSGRGVRYRHDDRWVKNVIQKQGGVIVEPYYNKMLDFAMEFFSDGRGEVRYDGLSLFETLNGAYKGNLLASETEKQKIICKYVDEYELSIARQHIIDVMSIAVGNIYKGLFGIDMMVYDEDGKTKLNPCVELNLRNTMGHVALSLTQRVNPDGNLPHQLMRIEYDGGHYHFRVLDTRDNILNTTAL